jgi:RNA polymerase sigma-70 factor (ECF subfamily)
VAEAVYRLYGPRIYTLARRMLGHDADAEDIAQEVLLRVVRRVHTFRGDSLLTTWLYRVTVNATLALRRKRAAARECQFRDPGEDSSDGLTPADPRAEAAPPDIKVLGGELGARIEAAIARLPEPYRDPFLLADVEHLSYAEICDVLGLSLPAVKSRLHRARLMLRDTLQPYLDGRGDGHLTPPIPNWGTR